MPEFIINAGFPKCGTTTVFSSLRRNALKLSKNGVFVFGPEFDTPSESRLLRPPLWQIEDAIKSPAAAQKMRDRFHARLLKAKKSDRFILSSENLANVAAPQALFGGGPNLDVDVTLLIYVRPQAAWITSSWKQWDMKDGISLPDAIKRHIKQKSPKYLSIIDAWRAVFPRARIIVRPFMRETLIGGDPAKDFYTTLEIDMEEDDADRNEIQNPSIDYALMHLMSKNAPLFFENRHDSKKMLQLTKMLPKEYLKVNIEMLDVKSCNSICSTFKSDNLKIMNSFFGKEHARIFDDACKSTSRNVSYMELPENDILDRARSIVIENFGRPSGDMSIAEHLSSILSQSN